MFLVQACALVRKRFLIAGCRRCGGVVGSMGGGKRSYPPAGHDDAGVGIITTTA